MSLTSNTITFCFSWQASSMPVMLWSVLLKKRTAVSTKALLHTKWIIFFNHLSTMLALVDFNLNALLYSSQIGFSVHPSWSKISKFWDKGGMKYWFKFTYTFLLERSLQLFISLLSLRHKTRGVFWVFCWFSFFFNKKKEKIPISKNKLFFFLAPGCY